MSNKRKTKKAKSDKVIWAVTVERESIRETRIFETSHKAWNYAVEAWVYGDDVTAVHVREWEHSRPW